MVQSINNRISRNKNFILRSIFHQKIALRGRCRSKMEVRNRSREMTVHLLRERGVLIMRAKSCLDVSHISLMIVRRQSSREGGRCITVHKHDIWLFLRKNLIKSCHGAGGNIEKRLSCRHYIQIIIRLYPEKIQHLIKHLTVLCRDRHHRDDFIRVLCKLQNHRRHFNSLRAGAKHGHDLYFFICHSLSPPFNGPAPRLLYSF